MSLGLGLGRAETHLSKPINIPKPKPIYRPQVSSGSVSDLSRWAPSPAQTPLLLKDGDGEALSAVQPPKTDRFGPPHLRPGFAGKEEKPGSDVQKAAGSRARDQRSAAEIRGIREDQKGRWV
ncbi:hypothetical protein CRG98_036865 [Punica granatum]|uniref:Uncharacterized protein n=1 Tax=Punica granatum TaxID=22663 RepID=A0A2I0IFH7_PUNGR|nr:hypothetical protein CRG98_036865 [Punica granatum]